MTLVQTFSFFFFFFSFPSSGDSAVFAGQSFVLGFTSLAASAAGQAGNGHFVRAKVDDKSRRKMKERKREKKKGTIN